MSRARVFGTLTLRGAFKNVTTSPARAWVIKAAKRGAIAAAFAGLFCYSIASAPPWFVVASMITVPALAYGFFKWLDRILPVNPVDAPD